MKKRAKNSKFQKTLADNLWSDLYKKGAGTARKYKITSEEKIDKILHEQV